MSYKNILVLVDDTKANAGRLKAAIDLETEYSNAWVLLGAFSMERGQNEQAEIATGSRHRHAGADGLDEFAPAPLVAGMRRQFLARRRAFAEVMDQRGKTHLDIRAA